MDTYQTEIMLEAGLKKDTRSWVQRLPRRDQNFMRNRRGTGLAHVARMKALGLQALMFITRLPHLTLRAGFLIGATAKESRLWHPHHLLSDADRLQLILIA
jgi:hypothetical protein